MIDDVSPATWLTCGYAVALLAVAYAIDRLARRASRSTRLLATTGFTYHEDHDAWRCPEDQWLWPTSFDPDNRVMRYRGTPSICNSCPVKDSCTPSHGGREVLRAVDAWPASEAARFHRGIACAVVVMAVIWPLVTALTWPSSIEGAVLLGAAVLVALGGSPLFAHLRRSPAGFPEGASLASTDASESAREADAATERRRRSRYASDRTVTTEEAW